MRAGRVGGNFFTEKENEELKEGFLCVLPTCQPTFQQRCSVNHPLCRNLIHPQASSWYLAYFCFLQWPLLGWSPPDTPSPWRVQAKAPPGTGFTTQCQERARRVLSDTALRL